MAPASRANMMTVVPEGGLCNRMRAVASAARLAQLSGKELRIQWHRTPDLNCAFGDLFETEGLPFSVKEYDATGVLNGFAKISWRLKEWFFPLVGVTVSGPLETACFLTQPELREAQLQSRRWYLRSFSKLLDGPDLFAVFKPVTAIQVVIHCYLDRLEHSVGVHIRRSDNKRATQHSPLNAFIELMHAEQAIDPDVSFYVATDSHETYAQLKQEFGDAVFSHPKPSLQRDDPQAIRDAVVDLFALGACRRLIGSYYSSFSDTAWELRGIPHVVVNVA